MEVMYRNNFDGYASCYTFLKEIGVGKKLGFPGARTSFQVAETKIKTTYLIRMNETTFCHDVIVIASLLAHYGSHTIPVTEWYRFRTIRSVQNDLMGELEVSIYRHSDNIKGRTLLNCLAPDFGFGNAGMEDGAAELLRCYYDKALRYPCRVDGRELADNMGYAVREEALSADRRIRSREPVLNALLAYEAAVYVDGFVCMNDPQYVTSGKWGRQLTTRALDISKNQLAAVTTMDEDRLKNIRRNKVKSVSFDEVILLGLGLGLQPEELDDLMEKSTAKFDRSERCSIIRVLYRKLYEYPVTTFNEALIACNQKPLSNAS